MGQRLVAFAGVAVLLAALLPFAATPHRADALGTAAPAGGEIFGTTGATKRVSAAAATPAEVLPPGFTDTTVLSGLDFPGAVAIASDGKVFVAERSGIIKVYDSLSDPTPTVFADLSTQVYNAYDRGMLGLAIDPQWPTRPYVYVLYAYDGDPGGKAPKWGTAGTTWDECPTPPGANTLGCVISNRLSRLTANGDVMSSEQVLVSGWCQQFSSHSAGSLKFGPDGSLYASAGEGASYLYADYGQTGNPCADPPLAAGANLTVPAAEGGSLRAQSTRRAAGQPVSLGGSLIRVSPDTGDGVPANPMFTSTDINRRRILAYGFRNPFRFNLRPGTGEVWLGDVGAARWEEIDRVDNPAPKTAYNFGWPCYEGAPQMASFANLHLSACTSLYSAGSTAVTAPYFAYAHQTPVVTGEGCPNTNGSSVSGLSFYAGSSYPATYQGALFFEDYSRNCIWYLPKGANGLPDAAHPKVFAVNAAGPVDLEAGPGGDLLYVDMVGGAIHRISYTGIGAAPKAVATASATYGAVPLVVQFSAAASTAADGGSLTYAWDLNGDGAYDDSTAVAPKFTYTTPGTVWVGLKVTASGGTTNTTTLAIAVGNTPPVPTIAKPAASLHFKVGDPISFAGGATDAQDGQESASRLNWTLLIHHCPSGLGCHTHPSEAYNGVASGSFAAPDHDYPSYFELVLTATDSGGLSASTSVRLTPDTAQVLLQSSPTGLTLGLGDQQVTGPATITTLARSNVALDAPSPQVRNGFVYTFAGWSDGGAAAHNITTPVSGTATYTATFTVSSLGPNDTFGGTALDPKLWSSSPGGSIIAVGQNHLTITHSSGAWTKGSVTTALPHDQTGKALRVELVRPANGGAWTPTVYGQTTIALDADATHDVRFFVAAGSLTAWSHNGTTDQNLTPSWPPYNPTTMRFLRFREAAGRLFWEYAATADGAGPWTVLASAPDPIPLNAVHLRIMAGSNTPTADATSIGGVATTLIAAKAPLGPFGSAAEFVARQYRDFVGRPPTAAQLQAGIDALASGTGPDAFIALLRSGQDAVTIVDPVTRLYLAYFLRAPDAGGLNFWLGAARSGRSLWSISGAFAASPEFVGRYGTLSNAAFVTLVYRNVLGRAPDASGLAWWVGQLGAGAQTRGGVMVGFSESAEYRSLEAPQVTASVIPIAMLGRAPTAAELLGDVAALKNGTASPATIAERILTSEEYATHVGG